MGTIDIGAGLGTPAAPAQDYPQAGFTTRQVHAGRSAGQGLTPRATPLYLTAGFEFTDYDQAASHFAQGEGFAYTRHGNPTTEATEAAIADLEGGAQALLLASGQAAISVALLTLVGSGQRIAASGSLYEGTRGLFLENLPRLGIETDFVTAPNDADAWAAVIGPQTRALFVESIPNARNDITDIAAIARVAHAHGLPLIVDNTLATPYLLRPIEHGADVVVHSASKFLAGQGSVLGGVIIDNGAFDAHAQATKELFGHLTNPSRIGTASYSDRFGGLARIAYARESVAPRFGPTPSPLNAFLIGQGVETLSLRVARQSETALDVAKYLEAHPRVLGVDYSGLPSSPHHDLASTYLPNGQGSVFTFTIDGEKADARAFIEGLRLFTHMTHLGDVRSLILHPASTSHSQRTAAEQAAAGVHPGTLRVSIGIEDAHDLIADLERGFAAL